MILNFKPMPYAASVERQNSDTSSSSDSSKPMEPPTKEGREYEIGDIIPIDQVEKTGTFHLLTFAGEKYLVDHKGRVVLKPKLSPQDQDAKAAAFSENRENPKNDAEMNQSTPQVLKSMKMRVKPGTQEFSSAVKEADHVIKYFVDRMKKLYRQLAPRFANHFENNHMPYIKYMEFGVDPMANLKAYLIREFFCHTIIQERGLEIIEFLTNFIALDINEQASDCDLNEKEQKSLVSEFLDFIKQLGDSTMKKEIFEKTYKDFINQDYEWMKSEGGVGHYISTSLLKTLKSQRDFLVNKGNCYYVESTFRKLLRSQTAFFLDHMLAYLKALTILRLITNSRKEDRGKDENEREKLLYLIIVFKPQWYQQKLSHGLTMELRL